MKKKAILNRVRVVNPDSAFYRRYGTIVGRGKPKQAAEELGQGYIVRFAKNQEVNFSPRELEFL